MERAEGIKELITTEEKVLQICSYCKCSTAADENRRKKGL